MEDPYAKLRHLTRAHLGIIWEMVKAGAKLEGEEAVMGKVLKQHPEYFDVWENAATAPTHEEVLRDGVNPFLHVAIHQTVENQIADRTPPQAAETLETLMQAGYTRHEAIHAIGNLIASEIFGIMKEDRPFDEASYIEELNELAQKEKRPQKRRRSRRRKRQ